MSLEMLFLGTGTSAGIPMIGCPCEVCASDDPRDTRSRPSVMIRYPRSPQNSQNPRNPRNPRNPVDGGDNGQATPPQPPWQLLIDTTPELRIQSIRHQLDRLDGVLLTHAHADHVMGLDDLRRFNAVMKAPLDLYAEQATLDRVKHMFSYIFDTDSNINDTFIAQLVPRSVSDAQVLTFGPARWTPVRLFHGKLPIVGYRIDLTDGDSPSATVASSVAYCTDVSHIPDDSIELLRGLDVLVLDALRYRPHPTHMTVDQALAVIERVQPKRAYLTHIAHDIRHEDLQARLPDNVFLAYDGLEVNCD